VDRMRLVTYVARGQTRVGAEAGTWIIDLNRAGEKYFQTQRSTRAHGQAAAWLPPTMTEVLLGGADSMAAARDAVRHVETALRTLREAERLREEGVAWNVGEVRRLPVVPNPPKILCVGRNYAEHAREGGAEPPELPIFFGRFPHSLLGPGEPYVLPAVSQQVDYEGELAAVIGRRGHAIPEADALDYVAGYTIFNDISIRDFQRRTSQWMLGKNFDRSGPLGPALVTRDEVPDPQDLQLTVDVSGERMQEAHTGIMIFSVAHLVSYVSQALTLEPGDVIATGTPSGVGFARKPPRWLRAGDTVRVSITRLGVLETPIVAA
jgi:acylpyruvate hydrolase